MAAKEAGKQESKNDAGNAVPSSSPMRAIKISKVVINMGTGSDDQKQLNAVSLLEKLTGSKPAASISRHRLPEFKIAKGQKIGAFVSLRGKKAEDILKRLFGAVDNKLSRKQVVNNAVNFGIKEYIDINGLKYDPKIGMMGMNVNVAFSRPGMRVQERKRARGSVAKHHALVAREEIISFLQKNFKVSVE
ncbi:MAG: 50S ribosomal protein L5 [Candidatus Micrarchaeia archaeon]